MSGGNTRFPVGPIADASGNVTLEWSQWLQNPQFVSIDIPGILGVASGGTGIALGVSGGILGFTNSTTIASSASLPAHAIVLGGGAGATPTASVALGTSGQFLQSQGAGFDPVFATISGGGITGAALSKADDTNVTLTLGGTPATALLRATSITAGWTGTLSPARGGTGVANTGTATITANVTINSGGISLTGGSLTFPVGGGTAATLSGVETLTNKRVTPRAVGVANATSITPNSDTSDFVAQTNTQSAGALTINAPSGTPTGAQTLSIRIKSTNVQTFAWDTAYRGSTTLALPAATTGGSATDYFQFIYDLADTKWDLMNAKLGFT